MCVSRYHLHGKHRKHSNKLRHAHGEDGMYGSIPPPPVVWVHGLLIPALSSHLKLICESILLDFSIDLACFCLYNFHQIILSLFIEGAPRGGLYGITPNLVAGALMDRICAPAQHPKQLSITCRQFVRACHVVHRVPHERHVVFW